jgi:sialate O-acetylesterase
MKITFGLAEGQVLQRLGVRGATAKIEGKSPENGAVTATISQAGQPLKGWKKKAVGKAVRGKFSAMLKDIPTGGPYQLKLEAGDAKAEVPAFYVGDVWVLAGQSNMEGIGNISGAAKPHPLIRGFSMRRTWRLAEDPLHLLGESPDICHNGGTPCAPEAAEKRRREWPKGTGVGIFFARELLKRSGVPQGLISTAHGGTSMEQWSPERKKLRGESLYWSMLESVRVTGQPVSGVLWYQGESDANEAAVSLYTKRMQKLVAASRRDLKQAKLPWIIVQLARFYTGEPNGTHWNDIQEQQRLLPGKVRNLETVPAIDLPMDDQIHVGAAGFVTLGQRMARVADRMVYGSRAEKRPPTLREIRVRTVRQKGSVNVGHWIEVVYDGVVGGLECTGEPEGFVLVNLSGKAVPLFYKTTLNGNRVRLDLIGSLPPETRLSYGHGYVPNCKITDGRGFALPVFGPLPLNRKPTGDVLPFVMQWKASPVVAASAPLDKIPCPNVDKLKPVTKTYGENGFSFGLDGFINEHPTWDKKTGQAFFQAKLELPEAMTLQFLMGYDGPFRLWLDGKPFFTDMKGVNPCMADKSRKVIKLNKGSHDIRVGMEIAGNHGQSWGFFVRFRRMDLSPTKRRSGNFAKPVYSV